MRRYTCIRYYVTPGAVSPKIFTLKICHEDHDAGKLRPERLRSEIDLIEVDLSKFCGTFIFDEGRKTECKMLGKNRSHV